ncbi:MAG: hypothetical protein KJZ79_18905 [Bryobacteraceae bacterium]|nr:hypothetical protein [Bryobacteraceae bacterium]
MSAPTAAPRTFRRDGIPELLCGLLWLFWGFAFLVPALNPHWLPSGPGGFVLPVSMLLGALCVRPATRVLKKRLLKGHPPKPPAPQPTPAPAARTPRVFTVLFVLTLTAALVWVLLPGRSFEWQRLIPIVLAIVLAALHAFIAWKHHLARYRLLALYILAAGATLSSLPITPALAFSLFLLLLGAGSALAGYAALRAHASA